MFYKVRVNCLSSLGQQNDEFGYLQRGHAQIMNLITLRSLYDSGDDNGKVFMRSFVDKFM